MKTTRQCQVLGHEMNSTIHLCTYKDCTLTSKWVCADCSFESLHSHGQLNQNHIMKQQQFLDFTINQSQNIFDLSNQHTSLLQQCIKQLDQFVQQTVLFKKILEQDLDRIDKLYNISELQNIIKIVNNEFLLLQKQQIDLIINIKNNQQVDFTLQQDLLKQVITQVQQLQQLIIVNSKQDIQVQQEQIQLQLEQQMDEEFINQEQEQGQIEIQLVQQQIILEQQQIENNKFVQKNKKIYFDHFDFKSDNFIKTSQISEDEKYLAIGGDDCKLLIYDMITTKQVKQFELHQYVSISRFTNDSRYLICGDASGYLYCYDLYYNFSQIYERQIHKDQINDILFINNEQIITCSLDKSIIITNMLIFKGNQDIPQFQNKALQNNLQSNEQQLQIHHRHYINGIDFDYEKDYIISCSSNRSISFFMKQNGEEVFEQQVPHKDQILQIQIIPNNKIISSDSWSVMLWQIDYNLKLLKKIRVFKQMNNNFTFVNNNRIVIICKGLVFICDQNLNLLYSQENQLETTSCYFRTRQINSSKYIIIPILKRVQVIKLK